MAFSSVRIPITEISVGLENDSGVNEVIRIAIRFSPTAGGSDVPIDMRAVSSIPFALSWSMSGNGDKENDNMRQSMQPADAKGNRFLMIKDARVALVDSKGTQLMTSEKTSRYSPRSSSIGLIHVRKGNDNLSHRRSTEAARDSESLTSPSMPPLSPDYALMLEQESNTVMEMLDVIEAEVAADTLTSPSMPPLSPDYSLMDHAAGEK